MQLDWNCWLVTILSLAESLRFSMYKPILFGNNYSFTSSFWMLMTFVSLSHQIAPVRTSAILNESDKRGPLCFVTDLRWKGFNFFSFEYNVRCVFLVYGLYFVEVCSFYAQSVEYFYRERMLCFVKWFFYIQWDDWDICL